MMMMMMMMMIIPSFSNNNGISPISFCFLSRVTDNDTSLDAMTSTDILHSSKIENTFDKKPNCPNIL